MHIWKVKPTIAFEHEDRTMAFQLGKYFLRENWKVVKQSRAIDAQRMLLAIVGVQMARWNPKPSMGFQRTGAGYILVLGNKVIQFDAKFNKTSEQEVPTHFQAVQQALLMIGALEVTGV